MDTIKTYSIFYAVYQFNCENKHNLPFKIIEAQTIRPNKGMEVIVLWLEKKN